MNISEDITEGLLISAYEPGKVTIDDNTYTNSIIIMPNGQVSAWAIKSMDELLESHCVELMDDEPELVLIGTGDKHILPDLNIIHHFAENNIGIEVMSTSAACRTYNILVTEGRKIAAGLIV